MGRERAQIYESLQLMRADYRASMNLLEDYGKHRINVTDAPQRILDVACGTAVAARTLLRDATHSGWSPREVVGLDFDQGLLDRAPPFVCDFLPVCGDMLDPTAVRGPFQLIISSFAYHHSRHEEKAQFCRNLNRWAEEGARLLVFEICLSPDQVRGYYTSLSSILPFDNEFGLLASRFLDWTMSADKEENGEWKVPLARTRSDFSKADWVLVEERLVWQPDGFPYDAGCYLLEFRKRSR